MTIIEARITKALRGAGKKGLTGKELAKKMSLRKTEREELRETLLSMVEQVAVLHRGGRYYLTEALRLTVGEIVKVTGTFGFARPAEGEQDVFVPGRYLMGSMPGDKVLLKLTRGTGQLPEGEVVQVVAPVDQAFSGTVGLTDGEASILPDRYVKFPIKIPRERLHGAQEGEKVLAELCRRGDRHSGHRARVLERFGSADSAAACCRSILAANGVHSAFPDEVLEQAQALSTAGIHPKELAARVDRREELLFTIDGADAKDLDDAVSLRRLEDGWELGVHIADVSYYVTHRSPLDLEAFERGTSVYYADSVVPMLPPELSNGICSLNPRENRLAFSAIIQLDEDAKIRDYRFEKSVIRSRVKGVYSEVNALLEGTAPAPVKRKYRELLPILEDMRTLAGKMTANRTARGGMDLESVESRIILHPDGTVADVLPRTTGISEGIVEEFMLTANEAAAHLALQKGLPFVFRVHEKPAPDKLAALYEVLDSLGIPFRRPKNGATPAQLSAVLREVKGTPLAPIVNTMLLRSMAKAKYAPGNLGHFGLALDNYAHFTSPIRRYPDLVIHRVLSGYVTGMRPDNIQKRFGKFVGPAAIQSTQREIAAMTAERDCEDCYKAEYMGGFVGETFGGVISSVTAFGAYVRLPNTVEGLVGLHSFPPGEWEFDGKVSLVDRVTGQQIRLGDEVSVTVAAVNVSAGQVDFTFAP